MADETPTVFTALCEGDGRVLAIGRSPSFQAGVENDAIETVRTSLFDRLGWPELEQRFADFARSARSEESFSVQVGGIGRTVRLRKLRGGDGDLILVEAATSVAADEDRYQQEAGRLVSRLLHDFKNQLGGIKLYIGYLKKRFADQEELVEIVDKVALGVDGLVSQSALVSSLTRPLALQSESNDLSSIVQGAIQDQQKTAEDRRVKIEMRTEDGAPGAVLCDARLMRTAITAMIARGVETAPPDSRVLVSVGSRNGMAVIEVSDSGETPNEDRMRAMFNFVGPDRMTTVSLGLTMARRIVELHGGRVSGRPEAAGATLSIEIPHGTGGGE